MEQLRMIAGPSPMEMADGELMAFVYEEVGRINERIAATAPVAVERRERAKMMSKKEQERIALERIMAASKAYVAAKAKGEV